MPNHVINKITASKEVIQQLMDMKDDKPFVNFNKIIPMPECISGEDTNCSIEWAAKHALGVYSDEYSVFSNPPKDYSEKDFEIFISYLRTYRKTGGYMTWLDWRIQFWGTKWNSYSLEQVSDTEITFETAWSAPHPVIEKLASITNEKILHEWADEDTGRNVGLREYVNGSFIEKLLAETKEGYELAFKFRPEYMENYKLVDGNYIYIDEDELEEEALDGNN